MGSGVRCEEKHDERISNDLKIYNSLRVRILLNPNGMAINTNQNNRVFN